VTSFHDLGDFVAVPRVSALRLSPDGSWLAAAVQTVGVGEQKNKYVTSIWRISPHGEGAPDGSARPVRLTRSAEGEGAPEFLPDGSVLFASKRPGPSAGQDGADTEADKAALWLLPAGGGEARRIAAPSGGVTGIAAARAVNAAGATAVVVASPVLPGASGPDEDAKLRKARKDAGVTAILHESGPLRYWDHDLGPDSLRLLAAEIASGQEDAAGLRDLTPDPGRALDENSFEVTPDGSSVVTGWSVWEEAGGKTDEIHVIDTATGQHRALLAQPGHDFGAPHVSPDGRLVASKRAVHDSYAAPGDVTLVVAALDGSDTARDLLPGLDRRPQELAWAPDSASVYFTADNLGRCPVYRVDLATGDLTRLTSDDGAYASLCPAPDGQFLYALRSAIDEPPTPVRIDVTAAAAEPARLASPGAPLDVPGHVEELFGIADDGTALRAWLVLPHSATAEQPAPLVLWAHGGPVMSFNTWSWRWNPWLLVARGYAVLMPDPALSTGYGHDFIARGHGQWGGRPYTDLMTITDAAMARPDIDQARTAMMGGSFGGYMANWIAGHSSRFRAIVSHAGLWALDQMFGTTDLPSHWRRTFGDPATQPERYTANSPDRHADRISTPMLVIHGDKDYRVPVSEALRLWWDLQSRAADVTFLYFPDENHWVLTPGHATVWYETVLAFLAQHVLGEQWRRPELL